MLGLLIMINILNDDTTSIILWIIKITFLFPHVATTTLPVDTRLLYDIMTDTGKSSKSSSIPVLSCIRPMHIRTHRVKVSQIPCNSMKSLRLHDPLYPQNLSPLVAFLSESPLT